MAKRGSRQRGRAERPAHPADVEAVGYGPDEPPRVPERYAHLPVRRARSGRANRWRRWNRHLSKPKPLTVYVVDKRYVFVTDRSGRVTHAEGWLGWLPSKQDAARRDRQAQLQAGRPDRLPTDDGGHLFAASLDGPPEAINLTAQSRTQNRSVTDTDNWRRMEESWQALRASGIQVHGTIDVRYPDATSRRPSARKVFDRHEGVRSPRRSFRETRPPTPPER